MLGVVEREMLAVRSRQERRRGSHKMRILREWRRLERDFVAWLGWRGTVLIPPCGRTALCCVRYDMLCLDLIHFECEKGKIQAGAENIPI